MYFLFFNVLKNLLENLLQWDWIKIVLDHWHGLSQFTICHNLRENPNINHLGKSHSLTKLKWMSWLMIEGIRLECTTPQHFVIVGLWGWSAVGYIERRGLGQMIFTLTSTGNSRVPPPVSPTTIPYPTIPYHSIPYRSVPYHFIPYRTIPYYTVSYHTPLYHTTP